MFFKLGTLLITLLTLTASTLHADNLTAEVQTRLKILGEAPGIIDGVFGKKTNSAINKILGTEGENYSSQLPLVNEKLISQIKTQTNVPGRHIFETTSDFLESQNTDIQFFKDHRVYNYAQMHFDRGRGGSPSKWYQPDLNGDGTPDLVIFGLGQDYVSECAIEKCDDEWMREPLFFVRSSERQLSSSMREAAFKLVPHHEMSTEKLLNRGTGGKSIFVDFNNDGIDDFYLPSEGPITGPNIHVGGTDVLMMSKPNGGYEDVSSKYDLLNSKTFQHWAAAGDIDNDGDVDFIFHNLRAKTKMRDKISCFFNDGLGNFTVKNCVAPPNVTGENKFYSWGATLFDLNGDNFLDLWLSRGPKHKPIVLLGDGTGSFDEDKYVDVYLPKNWPKQLRQFGYILAADLEDDGFNEIFFSVQGSKSHAPELCKGIKGYCGSSVGYFKNKNGFLEFAGFLKHFDKRSKFQWTATSMIVVKDYWGNDGLKDVYLKRNHDEGASPFIIQKENGEFVQLGRYEATALSAPNNLKSLEINFNQLVCANAVQDGKWIEGDNYWKLVAIEKLGFDAALCQFYADK